MHPGVFVCAVLQCVLLLLLVAAAATAAQNLSSRSDLAGLYALRASLGLRAQEWPRKVDPCSSWAGVGCRGGRVVSLNLSGLRRTRAGKLSPQFAVDGLRNLTVLETFNASGFALPGTIPDWLGTGLPPSFSTLDLSGCSVAGRIPVSVGNLTGLAVLILSQNAIAGQLRAEIGNLKNLKVLNLGANNISGDVPPELWSLPALQVLDLSNNNLTGSLSDESLVSLFRNGTLFDISSNLFYGTIPARFGDLFDRVETVNISGNYFDGIFPASSAAGVRNVSVQFNCFRNALDQRSIADCTDFYGRRGLPYDGPVAPPLPSPVLPPAAPPEKKKNTNHKLLYILLGSIGGTAVILFLLMVSVLCIVRRRPVEREGSTSAPASATAASQRRERGLPAISVVPVNSGFVGAKYMLEQLAQATTGFSDGNLIKHGHSGDLYRGILENGSNVVVKKIGARIGKDDGYRTELDVFAKGTHVRLVPFLGQSTAPTAKDDDKFLVYSLVPNGDLASALRRKPEPDDEDAMHFLDWIKRLKIATGIAEALFYLHHERVPPLVHRDIQASSILLDDRFEVRLGSLSEACSPEGTGHQNVITRLLRLSSSSEQGGSSSFTGPPATRAYDVYCFGKVLLELVTGRLDISGSDSAETEEWIRRTTQEIKAQGKQFVARAVDPTLVVDEDHLEEVWAMAIVAMLCLNPKPSKRPPIRHILRALENPLKVVRYQRNGDGGGASAMRASSSRVSWGSAFFGSWRASSSDTACPSRLSGASRSQGSNGERSSSSRRRHSNEIFPEPTGIHGSTGGGEV